MPKASNVGRANDWALRLNCIVKLLRFINRGFAWKKIGAGSPNSEVPVYLGETATMPRKHPAEEKHHSRLLSHPHLVSSQSRSSLAPSAESPTSQSGTRIAKNRGASPIAGFSRNCDHYRSLDLSRAKPEILKVTASNTAANAENFLQRAAKFSEGNGERVELNLMKQERVALLRHARDITCAPVPSDHMR
jgi:hypothetical protein